MLPWPFFLLGSSISEGTLEAGFIIRSFSSQSPVQGPLEHPESGPKVETFRD